MIQTLLKNGINIQETNEYCSNWVNILFASFWLNILKGCAIINLFLKFCWGNERLMYKIWNNYTWKHVTPALDVSRIGDLESINYMVFLNKTTKALVFDFSLKHKLTKESAFHLAAKCDQYHIIDSLANTNADILAYDKEWNLPWQVSSRTLVLIWLLTKIRNIAVKEQIYKRCFKPHSEADRHQESKIIKKWLNTSKESYTNCGSFFPHFLMSKQFGMEEVSDIGHQGEPITYAKSKSIVSYSEVMKDHWYKLSQKKKTRRLKQRFEQNQNCHSSTEKMTEVPFGSYLQSTVTSSKYINSKMSSMRQLKVISRTNGDSDIEIDFSDC